MVVVAFFKSRSAQPRLLNDDDEQHGERHHLQWSVAAQRHGRFVLGLMSTQLVGRFV
jgi:hypothetical protein